MGDLLDSYRFEIDEAGAPQLNIEQLRMEGQVLGHNRNQSMWKLVRRVIDTVFPPVIIT
jgi:hypothetical protein